MKFIDRSTKEIVEAIQFLSTDECITQLQQFCGSSFVKTGCDQVPNAVPWLMIDNHQPYSSTYFAAESDWIVKFDTGRIMPINNESFHFSFEKYDN